MVAPARRNGRRLVLYLDKDSKPRKAREFRKSAERVFELLGGDARGQLVPVRDGKTILEAVKAQEEGSLDRVVICTHGWTNSIGRSGQGVHARFHKLPRKCGLKQLCRALGPRLWSGKVVVALAACNAGRDPRVAHEAI